MSVTVRVNMFSVGRRRRGIEPVPTTLREEPRTVGDLIAQCVEVCVERQRRRAKSIEPTTVTDEEVDEMAKVGKIAFDIDYNGAPVALDKAISHALEAYEDGIFRIFCNGVELKGLDAPVDLHEDDVFTFVRLVALAGTMW